MARDPGGVPTIVDMRRVLPLALAAALLIAACDRSGDEETPVACLQGAEPYVAALTGAPGIVQLDEGTRISACLVDNQPAADLNTVGQALVGAATKLNQGVRGDPAGAEALRLGYLMGAASRGAADTSGIHADLLRRLNSAAHFTEGGMPFPAAFERQYGRGYAAGRRDG